MPVKIPKNQQLWLTKYDGKGNPVWIITSDLLRTKYHLYKYDGETLQKVKTADSPAAFSDDIGTAV